MKEGYFCCYEFWRCYFKKSSKMFWNPLLNDSDNNNKNPI